MKTMALLTGLILTTSISAQPFHHLEFSIQDVKSADGKIYVQLFKGEDNFNSNNAISAQIIPANQGDIKITFSNLTPGEYAVRYFHDEDNNGSMATNLFGMPSEGYGFSNNAKPNMGPASFEDAKFTVSAEQKHTQNFSKVIY